MNFAGIDIGSTTTKIVIYNDELQEVVASVIGPTGAQHRRMANKVMQQALEQAGIPYEDITYIVATGYGRINVPFADKQITEISCHARGIFHHFPNAKTVIDIGGQDCKGIKIKNGKVDNFAMNDKCAAGTGRYMEVVSEVLGITVAELGPIALRSNNPASISSTCTVFAEQEVVTRMSEGVSIEDVCAGILEAIARRVFRMVERIKFEKEVVFTGGGAKNVGLKRAIEKQVGYEVLIPPEPQLTGAIGAALLGRDLVEQTLKRGGQVKTGERRLEEATFFS